ncbi:MAG: flagellar brake protein [Syntrophobacteraceae bacterium]
MAFRRIPFHLGAQIVLRSGTNPAHRAKTKILGVLENEFIMIETPVFAVSDNISAIVEGTFFCLYLHEGYLFTFQSTFRKEFLKNVILIQYPPTFELEQLRKHPRIRVNLEASVSGQGFSASGRIKDISEGGCLLELPKGSIMKGSKFLLTFTLPNDEPVTGVECRVMNAKFFHVRQLTEAGVGFSGPPAELAKIRELCRFCMRFKV